MTTPRLTAPTGCALCGAPLPPQVRGRFRRYCSAACGHVVRKAAENVKRWQAQRDDLDVKIAERQAFLDGVGRTWR